MKKICFSILICVLLCAVAALALVGCNDNALPRPYGLKLDGPTLTLSWRGDENAKFYIVRISGNGVADEKNTRKNSFSLANLGLGEGDYELRVKACADGTEFSDSDWSEPLTFTQDKDTGLAFKFINNNKEAEVVSLGRASGEVVIPDTFRGATVTRIGERAFAGKSALKKIVISNNVTVIGAGAFYNCASLESVTFSKNLVSIGEAAFQSCRSLAGTLTIPENVTSVGKLAFAYCSAVTELKLNDKLQTIGESAFSSCTELTTLTIPDNVKSVGNDAFSLCSKLKTVNFGAGLTQIGEYAFAFCKSIETLNFNAGLKAIGTGAFMTCENLNTVNFSDSVEFIGDSAFYKDSSLANVTFGKGIKTVGLGAFADTQIWETSQNEVYLCNWFLGFKDQSQLGANVEIKNGTIGVANYAFYGMDETVSSVILPDTVKILGTASFAKSKISAVVIGSGAEEIGTQAFYECDRLTMAVLGAYDLEQSVMTDSSLKVIGEQAFYKCEQLADIEIPSTVEVIESYAFNGTALYENSLSGVVYAGNWLVACDNKIVNGTVNVKDGTVGIANYAFYKCSNISGAQLPDSVKTVGRSAFYLCTNLATVTLPSNLEVIEDYTFYGCSKLVLPNLPQTVKSIGRSAFYKCALSNGDDADTQSDVLVIPDSVQTIGDYAFFSVGYTSYDLENGVVSKCGIDSVQIGSGVISIGANAFYAIDTLKSVTLGSGVKSIGEKAFYNCGALSKITFNEGLQIIGARAFYGCGGLTEIEFPNSLTQIGNYAFYKCGGLGNVKLSSNVQSVGDYAFYGCANLKSVVLNDGLKTIGKQAFRSCVSLTSVTLPGGITDIDAHAFYGCKNLTIYAQDTSSQSGWNARFNSGYRPVVWGCTLQNGYVYSVTKNENTVTNLNSTNTVTAPQREGYQFAGWSTVKNSTVAEYSAEELPSVNNGTVLYSVWIENNSETK